MKQFNSALAKIFILIMAVITSYIILAYIAIYLNTKLCNEKII